MSCHCLPNTRFPPPHTNASENNRSGGRNLFKLRKWHNMVKCLKRKLGKCQVIQLFLLLLLLLPQISHKNQLKKMPIPLFQIFNYFYLWFFFLKFLFNFLSLSFSFADHNIHCQKTMGEIGWQRRLIGWCYQWPFESTAHWWSTCLERFAMVNTDWTHIAEATYISTSARYDSEWKCWHIKVSRELAFSHLGRERERNRETKGVREGEREEGKERTARRPQDGPWEGLLRI